MRDILFRGKMTDGEKWVYGLPSFHEEHWYITFPGNYVIGFRVIPDTISEFTGLTDKNGKKIFDGDILKICYDSPLFDGYDTECICYNGIVKYENALFVCEENSKRSDALCALSSNEIEIIGNIHDNFELLEVMG